MKKIMAPLLTVIILLTLFNCEKKDNDILYDRQYKDEIQAAREDAAKYMTSNFIPGAAFAVAKENKIIYSEGMGLASRDLDVPVTRKTKFRIGDVSELFTSLIYFKMTEQGILHPDSLIQHYYSEFPEKRYPLKLQHLAHHISGIRSATESEQNWSDWNLTLQKGIDKFKNDTLIVPPQIYQFPSMFNYNLLGAIMEKATDKSFNTILKEYITDTLNLENTLIDNPFITIKNRSNFYNYNLISQVVNSTFKDIRFSAPSKGMLSNAEDMVKLGNALLNPDYFSDELKKKLFKPVVLCCNQEERMTNGWLLMEDLYGRPVYGKNGGVNGGAAALIIYPEEKLVVAAAINLTSPSQEIPVFIIAQHFLPEPEIKKRPPEQESTKEATQPQQ